MKTNLKIAVAGLIAVFVAIVVVAGILGKPVRVVIDPGHGGKDVGAVYGERYEKDDNLTLALLVNDKLREMGIESAMTRNKDKQISLENRCKFANFKKADLFVSLHRNSADGAKGVEIWIESESPRTDKNLAENILKGLDNAGVSQNRGVKSGYARGDGDYYVNSHTDMPSCLVELGFINSETDNKFFDENIDEYAQAIADAIEKSLAEE
jgi:N-acetylmuramoyl-L-alanine amidase